MPIFAVDASQLEWRTALELSRDEVGMDEIFRHLDTHSLNEKAFELPSRLIAKVYLFRTIFRGSGYAFSVDPDFMHVSDSPKFWDDVNEKFYKKYHGLDKQHNIWADTVLRGKCIEGPLGRQWKIPLTPGSVKIPWTTLTNYPVQGTGADVMMLVRLSAKRRIQERKHLHRVQFISTVHDDIKHDTPSEHIEELTDIYYSVFEDLPKNIKKLFGYDWVVPMACEAKYGPNMGNMQKIKR